MEEGWRRVGGRVEEGWRRGRGLMGRVTDRGSEGGVQRVGKGGSDWKGRGGGGWKGFSGGGGGVGHPPSTRQHWYESTLLLSESLMSLSTLMEGSCRGCSNRKQRGELHSLGVGGA